MSNQKREAWEQFRFAVVGPLLAAPPDSGELQSALRLLSEKDWQHPIDSERHVRFSLPTLERWYYKAKKANNPVTALRPARRSDAGCSRVLSAEVIAALEQQYKQYPFWSVQLHYDNLKAVLGEVVPSYVTIRRWMKRQGWEKKLKRKTNTPGAIAAEQRLATREVRSYEVSHVLALWHLDYHYGSLPVVTRSGDTSTPKALAVIDDRSRLICHIQWYLEENTENLVHGFCQALQKRGLPRALMTDNGSPMLSMEFTRGLQKLSIIHEQTLPYSPYQNAKQETFWATLEGRLMSMLAHQKNLTLKQLNEFTQVWVEGEYHRTRHRELEKTPLQCFTQASSVGRECPPSKILTQAFCGQTTRKLRKSDGTISLEGKRFEIPNAYCHLDRVDLLYASWDLSTLMLASPEGEALVPLSPLDKTKNADGARRALTDPAPLPEAQPTTDLPPALENLMMEYAHSGLPMPYLPKGDEK